MPTYQYACTACGHRFEAVQAFSDASLTDCPECAGRLRKVFSSVGIVFKGSGFYRTDSRTTGSDGGEKEKKSEKTSADSSGDSGSGTKKVDADTKSAAPKSDSGSTSSGSTAKKTTPAASTS